MKAFIRLTAILTLCVGCVSQPKAAAPVAVTVATRERSTGSLAFDPVIARGTESIDVSRDERGNSAYVGIEDSTTTYFNTVTDDRNSTDQGVGVDRETYSEKVGDIRR